VDRDVTPSYPQPGARSLSAELMKASSLLRQQRSAFEAVSPKHHEQRPEVRSNGRRVNEECDAHYRSDSQEQRSLPTDTETQYDAIRVGGRRDPPVADAADEDMSRLWQQGRQTVELEGLEQP